MAEWSVAYAYTDSCSVVEMAAGAYSKDCCRDKDDGGATLGTTHINEGAGRSVYRGLGPYGACRTAFGGSNCNGRNSSNPCYYGPCQFSMSSGQAWSPMSIREDYDGQCHVYNDNGGSTYGGLFGQGCGYTTCCNGTPSNSDDCGTSVEHYGLWDYED